MFYCTSLNKSELNTRFFKNSNFKTEKTFYKNKKNQIRIYIDLMSAIYKKTASDNPKFFFYKIYKSQQKFPSKSNIF